MKGEEMYLIKCLGCGGSGDNVLGEINSCGIKPCSLCKGSGEIPVSEEEDFNYPLKGEGLVNECTQRKS